MTMTYEEARAWLRGVNPVFCRPGLERVRALCALLGHPEQSLPIVHVAGTNGKGSFCALLDSVLRQAGYRTGRYTSPAVRSFNKRICVDGTPISDGAFAALLSRVRPLVESLPDTPTEFELVTAAALEHFRASACDVILLEAGMGGLTDATNLPDRPLLSVITGVALDHTAYLGETLQEIAAQKAGIVKEGRPALYGGESDTAWEVLSSRAAALHAPCHRTDRSAVRVESMTLEGTCFTYGAWQHLNLALLGAYQPYNAACVLDAVALLRKQGWTIPDEAVRRGLASARWPARFELLDPALPLLYDGAHNPEGITAAVAGIRQYFPDRKVVLLTGVMRDKDYAEIAATLAPIAAAAFTVPVDNPRALSPADYAATLNAAGIPATPCASPADALRKARQAAQEQHAPLICLGSLYLYREIRTALDSTDA